MSIILNENEWVKSILQEASLGEKPLETLTRVARYYFSKGHKNKEVRNKIELFILRCNPDASIPQWANTIDIAIRNAKKREAIDIDYIPVTEEELIVIKGLKGKMIQRLAFTLLCLSKYWNIVNNTDTYWVNTEVSEIMKMANIKTSLRQQCSYYRELRNKGLIEFSKMNTNVRILFATEDSLPIIKLSDFRNVGYQYQMYNGENFYSCQCCGIVSKVPNGRTPKYCKDCAAKIHIQQIVNSVMKHRGSTLVTV